MRLDFFTLYITIVLVALAISAIWAAVAWRYRSFSAARMWFAACLFIALGGAILPLQTEGSALPAAAGNGLVIFGFWMSLLGVRSFLSAWDGRWLAAAVAASLVCVALTIAFHGRGEALALIYAFGQSVPMALVILLLTGRRQRSAGALISVCGVAVGLAGHATVVAMNLWSLAGRAPFGDFEQIASFTMLGVIFSGILWNFGYAVITIDKLREEVVLLASIDPLTGAWNRRKLDERLAAENGRPSALLLLDLDHFKAVNDRFGHGAGDASLVHFVRLVGENLRETDLLARLGGDEFCVLMPQTTAREAHAIGSRIAEALRRSPLSFAGEEIRLSCSIGVSSWSAGARGTDTVLHRADEALYAVKAAGRNGIALAASPPLAPHEAEMAGTAR